jgi:hypothetical protein
LNQIIRVEPLRRRIGILAGEFVRAHELVRQPSDASKRSVVLKLPVPVLRLGQLLRPERFRAAASTWCGRA